MPGVQTPCPGHLLRGCIIWNLLAASAFPEEHRSDALARRLQRSRRLPGKPGRRTRGPLEVEGFLFKRLLERKPEKKQELLTLRDHLLASSSASDTLKVFPDCSSLHFVSEHSYSHSPCTTTTQ